MREGYNYVFRREKYVNRILVEISNNNGLRAPPEIWKVRTTIGGQFCWTILFRNSLLSVHDINSERVKRAGYIGFYVKQSINGNRTLTENQCFWVRLFLFKLATTYKILLRCFTRGFPYAHVTLRAL